MTIIIIIAVTHPDLRVHSSFKMFSSWPSFRFFLKFYFPKEARAAPKSAQRFPGSKYGTGASTMSDILKQADLLLGWYEVNADGKKNQIGCLNVHGHLLSKPIIISHPMRGSLDKLICIIKTGGHTHFLLSHDGAVSSSMGLITKRSWVRGSGTAMLSCGNWFTQPEMRTWWDVVAMRLSNTLCLWWQHVLHVAMGVKMCAGLEQAWVRANNTVKHLRAAISLDRVLYKCHKLLLLYFCLIYC